MKAMISQLLSSDKNIGSRDFEKENASSAQADTYQNADLKGNEKENMSSPQAVTSQNIGSRGREKKNASLSQAAAYQKVGLRGSEKQNMSSPQVATPQSQIASTRLPEGPTSKRCILLDWQGNIVAEGAIASTDPNDLVHHIPLGVHAWKVWVRMALDPKASLWRPTSEMSTIEEAVGSTVAWRKDCICFK